MMIRNIFHGTTPYKRDISTYKVESKQKKRVKLQYMFRVTGLHLLRQLEKHELHEKVVCNLFMPILL